MDRKLRPMGAFTLMATACLTIMVGAIIVPGVNQVAAATGLQGEESWLITLPSLGMVLFGQPAGRFIDRTGAWLALCIGLLLYGLLGAAGAFLPQTVLLLIDRFLLGGACVLVMTAGTTLISHFYQGQKRLRMIALQGMSIELGGVIFLSIGGVLATIGWRWPFVLYLTAWLLLAMVLVFIRRPQRHATTEPEAEGEAPGGSLRLVYGAAFASLMLFFVGIITIPVYFHALGINAATTGYFLSFLSLVAVAAASQMPKVVNRFSAPTTLTLAFACYTAGLLLYAEATTLPLFVVAALFMGTGFGFSIPLANHMTVERSPVQLRGRNLAYLAMAISLGQFCSSFAGSAASDPQTLFRWAAVAGVVVNVVLSVMLRREGR